MSKKKTIGRPTDFNEKIAFTICERIALGETLRAICRENGMPDRSTVFRWLEKHQSFRDQYARARDFQTESFCDEIIERAMDESRDEPLPDGRGGLRSDTTAVQRDRLVVDSLKWVMAKTAPKKYGALAEESLNRDGAAAVTVVFKRGSTRKSASEADKGEDTGTE